VLFYLAFILSVRIKRFLPLVDKLTSIVSSWGLVSKVRVHLSGIYIHYV